MKLDVNEQELCNFYMSNPDESITTTAKKFAIPYSSTRRILKKNKIEIKQNPFGNKFIFDINEEVVLLSLGRNNFNYSAVARDCGLSDSMVRKIAIKHGKHVSGKYKYNENYFENIDTDTKAYILGFIAADGCNQPERNCLKIRLQHSDTEILEKIAKELVLDPIVKLIKYKDRNYCDLTVTNKKISHDLEKAGIVKNKTFKLKVESWMTGEFSNSAILGLMDGDGSFYYKEKFPKRKDGKKRITPEKSWTFSFIGLRPLCEFMQEKFKEIGITSSVTPHTRYKNNPDKPLCTIRVYGNQNNAKLMAWLYKDCPIYMKRKHDNYLAMLEFFKTKRVNQFG